MGVSSLRWGGHEQRQQKQNRIRKRRLACVGKLNANPPPNSPRMRRQIGRHARSGFEPTKSKGSEVMKNTETIQAKGHRQMRVAKLETVLRNHKGNGFAHIITRTVPAMRKTGNPFHGNVFKVADVNIQAGFEYINSVNNQLSREGKTPDAEAKPRKWGQRIKGTPLVEHTN